jgi:hypothetical protein
MHVQRYRGHGQGAVPEAAGIHKVSPQYLSADIFTTPSSKFFTTPDILLYLPSPGSTPSMALGGGAPSSSQEVYAVHHALGHRAMQGALAACLDALGSVGLEVCHA